MSAAGRPTVRGFRSMRVLVVAAAGLLCLVAVAGYMLLRGRGEQMPREPGLDIRRAATEAVRRSRADMKKLRTVNDRLVKYEQVRIVPTGLNKPTGIALGPDGTLYAVGDRVLCFVDAASGEPRRRLELLGEPTCVTVDPGGDIYVGYARFIEVYGSDGALKTRWEALGPRSYLTSLTTDGHNVWAADAGTRTVVHYSTWGVLQGRIGEQGSGASHFSIPSPHFDVAVAPNGTLLVTNPGKRLVETYSSDGTLVTSWGQSTQELHGFCGCCNPTDIALMHDGRVVTAEKGLPRVKIYTSAGMLDTVVAVPDNFSATAAGMDLAVDAHGHIMVLDPPEGIVRVFAPKGTTQSQAPEAEHAGADADAGEEPGDETTEATNATDAAPAEGRDAEMGND